MRKTLAFSKRLPHCKPGFAMDGIEYPEIRFDPEDYSKGIDVTMMSDRCTLTLPVNPEQVKKSLEVLLGGKPMFSDRVNTYIINSF